MKRHAALQKLSREHHPALVFSLRIARADEAAGASLAAAVPEFFARELAPHFADEEAHVLPRLAAAGEADLVALVERTLDEHARLRELSQRLAAGDLACLKDFGLALSDHVRFEERELFPAAEPWL